MVARGIALRLRAFELVAMLRGSIMQFERTQRAKACRRGRRRSSTEDPSSDRGLAGWAPLPHKEVHVFVDQEDVGGAFSRKVIARDLISACRLKNRSAITKIHRTREAFPTCVKAGKN